MRKFSYFLMVLFALQLAIANIWAAREDCGDLANVPAKPIEEVDEDDLNFNNDYDTIVEEETGAGVVYLTLINGDQPKPNACGLNPSNDVGQWTGWSGPLNADNMTIGEGAGTRNEIVISSTYFPRGIGAHAVGTMIYDLTGMDYATFEGYVGMSDEKDEGLECGHGGSGVFVFTVDGTEMFRSELLVGGTADGNVAPVVVEFDISAGASELVAQMLGGDDGISCDHAAIGDPKLMAPGRVTAVSPEGRLTTTWGSINGNQ